MEILSSMPPRRKTAVHRKPSVRRKKPVTVETSPLLISSFTNMHLVIATAALVMAGTAAYIAGTSPLPSSAANINTGYGYNSTRTEERTSGQCAPADITLSLACDEQFKTGSFTCGNGRVVRLPARECKSKEIIAQMAKTACKATGVKTINYGTSCGVTKYKEANFSCTRPGSDTIITGKNTTCATAADHQRMAAVFCNSLTCPTASSSCIDPDGGVMPSSSSRLIVDHTSSDTAVDTCVDANTVEEYTCSTAHTAISSRITCGQNAICQTGACIPYSRQSSPVVNILSLDNQSLSSGNNDLFRFTISASGDKDIDIHKLTFYVSSKRAAVSYVELWDITNNHQTSLFATPLATTQENVEQKINAILPNELTIASGATRTFVLRGIVQVTQTPGALIAMSLAGDETYPANTDSTNNGMNTAAGIELDRNNAFIWSDRSAPNHNLATSDWTNGYRVLGLTAPRSTATIISR